MEAICGLLSAVVFGVLVTCIIFLALILFSLDQTDQINFALLLNLIGLSTYLSIAYIYSYFSDTMTANSYKIGDATYNSVWNRMSVEQQKAIMLIIRRSQKKIRLTGLGMVDCSLETFLKVIKYCLTLNF